MDEYNINIYSSGDQNIEKSNDVTSQDIYQEALETLDELATERNKAENVLLKIRKYRLVWSSIFFFLIVSFPLLLYIGFNNEKNKTAFFVSSGLVGTGIIFSSVKTSSLSQTEKNLSTKVTYAHNTWASLKNEIIRF